MKKLIILLGLVSILIPREVATANLRKDYPKSIKQIILDAAEINHVPGKVLAGICYVESRFNPQAINHSDGGTRSWGLCQIKLGVARSLGFIGTRHSLLKPEINAFYAAKLFRYHMNLYPGNIKAAIDSYNKGRFVSENSEYVKKVLDSIANESWEKHD